MAMKYPLLPKLPYPCRLIVLTILSGLVLLNRSNDIFAQSPPFQIPFLEFHPVIDGKPDPELREDCWKEFNEVLKSHEENKDLNVFYEVRYDYYHLYLIFKVNVDSIVHRDRAYQNGDGFHLVIAKPGPSEFAAEFHVLRFSPADPSRGKPALKSRWYYNIDLSGKSLGPETFFDCRSLNGWSYFELLLSWDDVYPYHPLFSDNVGFNLCFVKAVGQKGKNYYFLMPDDRIQSELSPRKYLTVEFMDPPRSDEAISLVRPLRNNVQAGQDISIRVASVMPEDGKSGCSVSLASADNYIFSNLRIDTTLRKGTHILKANLPAGIAKPDGYKLIWKCSDGSQGEIPFTILPEIDFGKERAVLTSLSGKIPESDLHTLLFQLEKIETDILKLKSYETAGEIRERFTEYRAALNRALSGDNPYENKTGMFRRAFLSGIDSTLQPYTIRVPAAFDRTKKYPLLVMLHGSGTDDQDILNFNLGNDYFIEVAPFGRGTSNCFTSGFGEIDVKEAIDDVIRNYPIDTSRIIIAGFSMGGYGAYRIFYEYPGLFRGVAVFSGHPNLAGQWMGPGYPDFLDENTLACFKNVPVFIYHSQDDLNCPYDLTVELVNKLRKSGAVVEFVTTTASGHGIIDSSQKEEYDNWLENLRN